MLSRRMLPLLLLLAGCGHSEPFDGVTLPDGLLPAAPTRMTYAPSDDILQGHSGPANEVFYQYCPDSSQHDQVGCRTSSRCVGSLPAKGGQRVVSICGASTPGYDSIKYVGAAARAPNGTLAWSYAGRRPSASFSISPSLYVQAPGEFLPREVVELSPGVGNGSLPSRLWWLSNRELVTSSEEAMLLIDIRAPAGSEVSLPRADAIDIARRELVRLGAAGIHVQAIGSETVIEVAVPAPETWTDVYLSGVSADAGRLAIIQNGNRPHGTETLPVSRILWMDGPGGEVREVARQDGAGWGAISLEPGGRVVVVSRRTTDDAGIRNNVDLFRLEVP